MPEVLCLVSVTDQSCTLYIHACIVCITIPCNIIGVSSVLTSSDDPPLLNDQHVQSGFCTRLLLNLLKREDTKEAHIRLLLMEIPIDSDSPPFNGSKIEVSVLLKRKFISRRILDFLFDCGMKAKQNDLTMAVEMLTGDNFSTLEMICAHFDGNLQEAFEVTCPVAVKHKKIKFVHYFLKKGCKLPCSSQELLTLALQKNSADIAESLLSFCTLSEVDIGSMMNTNLVNHPQLLSKMIDGGASPSGLGKKKPLAEAQQLTYLSKPKRNDLICLLLKKGSDCSHLCLSSKHSTTPLHIATAIALDAGRQ